MCWIPYPDTSTSNPELSSEQQLMPVMRPCVHVMCMQRFDAHCWQSSRHKQIPQCLQHALHVSGMYQHQQRHVLVKIRLNTYHVHIVSLQCIWGWLRGTLWS